MSLDQSRCPGTARSRENANSIRDADVIADMPQNSCPITAMNSSNSAPPLPSAWSSTSMTANEPASATAFRSLIANVSARIRTQPAIADTSTELTTPLAAARGRLARLLRHVGGGVVARIGVLRLQEAEQEDEEEARPR